MQQKRWTFTGNQQSFCKRIFFNSHNFYKFLSKNPSKIQRENAFNDLIYWNASLSLESKWVTGICLSNLWMKNVRFSRFYVAFRCSWKYDFYRVLYRDVWENWKVIVVSDGISVLWKVEGIRMHFLEYFEFCVMKILSWRHF